MASFIERITNDIADAMRRRDASALAPLRMLKAALMNREVETGRTLTDEEAHQVVGTLVKQRKDSIDQFRTGNRQDLVDKEAAEVAHLEQYLPPAADADTVARAIDDAVAETDAQGPKDMGRVMKVARERLAGLTVDGRALADAVKSRLSR